MQSPFDESSTDQSPADQSPGSTTEIQENGSPLRLTSQEHYVVQGNSKKQLYLMCIGLYNDDGTALFDISVAPFTKLKKRAVKPKREEFAGEVIRRAGCIQQQQVPKAANWNMNKCTEWLLTNPVTAEQDISFLKKEVQKLRNIAASALSESDEGEFSAGSPWRGNLPFLRLILCIIQDDIKDKYRRYGAVMSRLELDGRNSENRPPNVFELIADRWNDSTFNPTAPVSDCHHDYLCAIPCSYSLVDMLLPATPQKVKDHIAAIRTDLNRIISRWEQSGQGDGGRHGSDDEDGSSENSGSAGEEERAPVPFGALARRPAFALNSREAFLNGRPSYLLYFWEVADSHQLLQTTVQRIDDGTAASDAASVPTSVSYSTARSAVREVSRQLKTADQHRDILTLSQSINSLNESETTRTRMTERGENERARQREDGENTRSTRRRIAELEDLARDYRRKYAEADDINSRSSLFYNNEAERLTNEAVDLRQSLLGTPVRHNRTPPPRRDD